jgi:hypothetical protein
MVKINLKNKDYIYFGLVILCILLLLFLILFMKSETTQCINNPYIYGASKMGNVFCDCYQNVDRDKFAYFSFNETSIDFSPKEVYGGSLFIPVSLNNLSVTLE